jgi:hypothetical protein
MTQAEYDAFEAQAVADFAARKGARSVAFGDQVVTFESWDDIWKWLRWAKAQIPVTGTGSRTRYAATSKGI